MISGRIHSIESMGLVDGPGIRSVIFLQGCRLRCRYCHNPDTWDPNGGSLCTAEVLMQKLKRFKPYYGSKGGVTFSGGEPLLQSGFFWNCLSSAGARESPPASTPPAAEQETMRKFLSTPIW